MSSICTPQYSNTCSSTTPIVAPIPVKHWHAYDLLIQTLPRTLLDHRPMTRIDTCSPTRSPTSRKTLARQQYVRRLALRRIKSNHGSPLVTLTKKEASTMGTISRAVGSLQSGTELWTRASTQRCHPKRCTSADTRGCFFARHPDHQDECWILISKTMTTMQRNSCHADGTGARCGSNIFG